jgi:hypothetical protein
MCERVALPGGGMAIVCRGHGRRANPGHRWCSKCGTRRATKLCDGLPVWALAKPGGRIDPDQTCSKPLCDLCAHVRGTGDYCDDCVDTRRPRLAL